MSALALTVLRLGLGGVFVSAATAKLVDAAVFAQQIANFRALPSWLVPFAAATVPGVEIVAGLLLATGLAARAAAAVVTGMLAVFMVGLAQALVRGINLECGCFGGTDVATWGTVARDAALLVAALFILRAGPGRLTLGGDVR